MIMRLAAFYNFPHCPELGLRDFDSEQVFHDEKRVCHYQSERRHLLN